MVRLDKIKLVIIDVDGVLTDGGIIIDSQGNESKIFNVKDGTGINFLQRIGVKCAIISGRTCPTVTHRAEALGIKDVYQGARNKIDAYEEILRKMGLKDEEVCYIGDDLIDIPIIKRVGFSVAVADAVIEVREMADYITQTPGGKGAVREVVEKIIKEQGKWEIITERYF